VTQWKPTPRHQHYWNEVEWCHKLSKLMMMQLRLIMWSLKKRTVIESAYEHGWNLALNEITFSAISYITWQCLLYSSMCFFLLGHFKYGMDAFHLTLSLKAMPLTLKSIRFYHKFHFKASSPYHMKLLDW